jgi:hypothetical protein
MSRIIAFCNDSQNSTASRNIFQNMSPFCFLLCTIDTLPVYVRICTEKIPQTSVVLIFYNKFKIFTAIKLFFLVRNIRFGKTLIESYAWKTKNWINQLQHRNSRTLFFNASPDKFLPPYDADSRKSAALPAQVHVQSRWYLIFFTEGNDGSSVKLIGITNINASRSHSEHQHS